MSAAVAVLYQILPGSEVHESHGLTLRLSVPTKESENRGHHLAALFAAIEGVSEALGAASLETVIAQMLVPRIQSN